MLFVVGYGYFLELNIWKFFVSFWGLSIYKCWYIFFIIEEFESIEYKVEVEFLSLREIFFYNGFGFEEDLFVICFSFRFKFIRRDFKKFMEKDRWE